MFDCPIWIDRKSDLNDVLCIFHLELLRDLHFEIFFEFESEKNFFVSYKWTTKITLDALVTQPMSQLRPNYTELRSMDYYHQIFCRFRKCKRKVPPPSLHSTDFEKSWFFSQFLVMIFFQN